MLVHKTYKYRIYPNKEQAILIAKTIGCSRFVFNHFLAKWHHAYQRTGKGLTYHACSSCLPGLKREYDWLKEVDSTALQQSLKHLANAFRRFFAQQNKRPNFKKKLHSSQSYKTVGKIRVHGNQIFIPKLGFVTFAKSREVEGRILSATIRRTPTGKHFVSILTETDVIQMPKTQSSIGIDLGVNHFATLSIGDKVDNHRFTNRMQTKLKREQRKLSRRYKQAKREQKPLYEAKNYQKQKMKVTRLHEKVANQREDFLNKLSTDLIKNHDVICIENLNIQGMMKNRKLAKSISDVSWSSFVFKLEYKADWYGKDVLKIDRWFPSSQLCSCCGHRDGKKALTIRSWTCSHCFAQHDRDINASINIHNEGVKQLALVLVDQS